MPSVFRVGDRVRRISLDGGHLQAIPVGTVGVIQRLRPLAGGEPLVTLEGYVGEIFAHRFEFVDREREPPVVQVPQEEITLYTIIYKVGNGTPRSRGFVDQQQAMNTKHDFELSGYRILGMKKIKVRI